MKELLKDLKELRKSNAQKDLQAEMGYSYEEKKIKFVKQLNYYLVLLNIKKNMKN